MAKKKVEDLEIAIDQFLESDNLDVFKDFVGNCSGMCPYGEEEVGKAINDGDFNNVRLLLSKLTNFDDSIAKKEELADIEKESKDLANTTNDKRMYEALEKNAKDYAKPFGGKRSEKAIRDVEKYKEKIKDLANPKKAGNEQEYLDKKKETLEEFTSSDKLTNDVTVTQKISSKLGFSEEDKGMTISEKDYQKMMSSLDMIQKHFAEEEAKVEEKEVEETPVEEKEEDVEMTTIELPEDVADAIREALEVADSDEEDEEVEAEEDTDEEEIDEEEDEIEEEEEEDDTDEENFSEFYDFSGAVTDTICNLNKKVEKLSKSIEEESNAFITEFSMKEFRNFAESVTETISNIAARVDALANKVSKNEITKNIDNLKQTGDDYEEEFITKSDEPTAETSAETMVQNPECGVLENAQFSEDRKEKVKAFLTL